MRLPICHARRLFNRILLILTTVLVSGAFSPALAQFSTAQPEPPTVYNLDENGVDLTTGQVYVGSNDLSIGANGRGLSFSRVQRALGDDNSFNTGINTPASGAVIVTIGSMSDTFSSRTGGSSSRGTGALLTLNGSNYDYTTKNGTVYHFDASYRMLVTHGYVQRAREIDFPNGRTVTLEYEVSAYGHLPIGLSRVTSVSASDGYRLTFSYTSNTPPSTSADIGIWTSVSSVTASNMGTEFCTVSSCSSSWPTVSYIWNGSNTLVTKTNPLGKTSSVSYDSSARIVGIRPETSASDTLTFTYDSLNRVATAVRGGQTWTYSYSDVGTVRTTTVTDPLGHQKIAVADTSSGEVLKWTDENSKATSYAYTSSGYIAAIYYPEGNYVSYNYDSRGNLTSATATPKSGSGLSPITTFSTYDSTCSNVKTCNQPNTTTDANGNTTDYTYDPNSGGIATVTAPAPTTGATRPQVRYGYTALSAWYKNSSGALTQATPIYFPTSVSSCSTGSSCTGTSIEAKTTIAYQSGSSSIPSNLNITAVTKAAGDGSVSATTSAVYDTIGNITATDGPLAGSSDTTTMRYDADRRLVGVISADPDGGSPLKRRAVRTSYNDSGIVTTTEVGTVNGTTDTDWAGFSSLQQTTTTLDALNRKSTVAAISGGTTYALTQYSYDNDGRLDCTAVRMKPSTYGSLPTSACTATTGTGEVDRITKMTYDNANHVTRTTSAYGTLAASDDGTAVYSDNSQIIALTDAENNKTTYAYDGFDRLTKISFPSPTKGSGISSTTDYQQLTYDANGNVTSKRLRDGGTIAFGIDNLNRVASRTENGSLSRQYGYNLFGQLISSSWSGGGSPETMSYDALGRLTSRTEPYTTLSYQYDAAGRRTRLTWPDGLYISYNYDLVNEMTTVVENGSITLATYAYDDLGRRTSLTRGNGTATYYSYDGASRLSCLRLDLAGGGTLDCTPTASGQDNATTFGYNPADQIVSRTNANAAYAWTGSVNVNRSYTSNGLNQYSASGGLTLGYDTRGNLSSSGSSTYSYDALNHLVASNSAASALEYGSLDELQGYTLATGYPRFASDGGNIIAEYLWGAPSTLQRRYVYGAGADEPLVWYEGSGTSDKRWLVADERGSVVAVTNASGSATSINTYDEFGIPGAGNLGRFQYTGQAWLSEIGLYYYKARMYSPTLGRFMQTDPIGYGDGMNWYNYVGSDPINGTDPSGLCAGMDAWTDPSGRSFPAVMNCNPTWQGPSLTQPDAINTQLNNMQKILTGGTFDLAPSAPQPAQGKRPCTTIQERRSWHNNIVNFSAAAYAAMGAQVAFNVSLVKNTPDGRKVRAVADFIVHFPKTGVWDIHEIKTGDATLTKNQAIVYETGYIQVVGNAGIPVGLEDGDVVPFVFTGERRSAGCTK